MKTRMRVYSSDGRKCGERGMRKNKKQPITGRELELLRQKNIELENNEKYLCCTCGIEIEHNYGTENYPQCIICGNENADDYFPL